MASQSSPVSILFLASSLILARLEKGIYISAYIYLGNCSILLPVLKPYLNRSFGHAYVLGNTLPHSSGRSWILVKFDFECD